MQLVDALKMVANLQNEFDAYIEKIRDKADKSKFYISEKYKVNLTFISNTNNKRSITKERVQSEAEKLVNITIHENKEKCKLTPKGMISRLDSIQVALSAIHDESIDYLSDDLKDDLEKLLQKSASTLTSISNSFYGTRINSHNSVPRLFISRIEPFKSIDYVISSIPKSISTAQKVQLLINKVFSGLLATFFFEQFKKNKISFDQWFKKIAEAIKEDSAVLSFFSERFGKDLFKIDDSQENDIIQFLYERDLQFWIAIQNKFKDDSATFSKSCISCDKLKSYTYKLRIYRNIATHIGITDLDSKWVIRTLDIIADFAYDLQYIGCANNIEKLLITERYANMGYSSWDCDSLPINSSLESPEKYDNVDFRDYKFIDEEEYNCWKKYVIKIDNPVYSESYSSFKSLFFISSDKSEKEFQKVLNFYVNRKIMFRSFLFDESFISIFKRDYPFHPMFFSVLVEMGLSKEQVFEVALNSIKKAYEKPDYRSFLIMPTEIDLSYPPIEEKLIERYGLRSDKEKSSPLGWWMIKDKYLNVESSIIRSWSVETNIPSGLLVSLIKNTILLGFWPSAIYKDDIRFSMLEPNINHRLLEIALSTAKQNLGILWGEKAEGSIYFDTYLAYLFEVNLFGYSSSIKEEDVVPFLSKLGIPATTQKVLTNDLDGVLKELQLFDKIQTYQRAIYAYNSAQMMGKYE